MQVASSKKNAIPADFMKGLEHAVGEARAAGLAGEP
jgi:hypothetical protein